MTNWMTERSMNDTGTRDGMLGEIELPSFLHAVCQTIYST